MQIRYTVLPSEGRVCKETKKASAHQPTTLTFNAVAPVLFNTSDGSWNIRLLGFSVGGSVLGSFTAPIQAEVTPTPEPATLLLLCAGIAGGGIQRWRKRKTIA